MALDSRSRQTHFRAVPVVTAMLVGALVAGRAAAASRLALTFTPGTTDCGRNGFAIPAVAPFSGELDADTAGTTKLVDVGLGCLYFGGGKGTVIPPGRIPDGSVSYFDIVGTSLGASAGTGMFDCTRGAGPGQHCINGSAGTGGGACTTDFHCGGAAGSCARDANCYFGAPVPLVSPAPLSALSACLIDVVQNDAGGTIGTTTGTLNVTLPLSARVYLTGNSAAPCPRCVSGVCDPSWKSSTNSVSPDAGASCTPVGSLLTTNQCRPVLQNFLAPLPINLTPLTTGTASRTHASGTFCPSQANPGALGQPTARRIMENGAPGGDLTDGAAHAVVLGSVFCIPATGNLAVDGAVDLPGPGAIGLNASAQLVAGPKVVCVNNTPTVSGPLTVRDACTATEDTLGSFDALKVLLAAISAEDGGKTLRMSGINLQLVNGAGTTDTANGAGNLIVGYDVNGSGQPRSGSHNVVVGDEHGYASYSGVVAGLHNLISAPGAAVNGGRDNRALGAYAAVSGGIKNRAAGMGAAVSGGEGNAALGDMSSATGGAGNTIAEAEKAASITGGVNNRIDAKGKAFAASISGGSGNRASARAASVSGGSENEATVLAASVSGGANNVAGPAGSRTLGAPEAPSGAPSVSGGFRNVASGAAASATGGHTNEASGLGASVTGGHSNRATSFAASVSGGLSNRATWSDATVSGGWSNEAGANAASVCGGRENVARGAYSTVSGGWANAAPGLSAAVAGGLSNVAENDIASVSGGVENHASGYGSWVGGGAANQAKANVASVCGGDWNVASGYAATVAGGDLNVAVGTDSVVAGRCSLTATDACELEPALKGPFGLPCACSYAP